MPDSVSYNEEGSTKSSLEITRSEDKTVFDDENRQLWDELRSGSESAFARLYQKNFITLYHYGLRFCTQREPVKDCIHDLYVDLWNKRSELEPVKNVKRYLLTAVKRRLINQYQRSKKLTLQDSFEDTGLLVSFSREKEMVDQQTLNEKKEKVLKALNSLTERQQKAIRLKYYDNYTTNEIANKLAIDINSAYNLISKAMKRLKKGLTYIISLILLLSSL